MRSSNSTSAARRRLRSALLKELSHVHPAKFIVVTAATGFGRLAATLLAETGRIVYASMRGLENRKSSGAQKLHILATEKNLKLYPG